jgi:dUTP pyrophosphatase
MNKFQIYRKEKSVPLPKRKTSKSAGMDIYCSESVDLPTGRVTLIETGLIIAVPENCHFKVYIRSGFAVKNNVSLVNDVGIIDEDYCGEEDFLKIPVIRHRVGIEEIDNKVLHIEKGERIAQMIVEKTDFPEINWIEKDQTDFAVTSRGGFGSTGKF